MIRSSAAHPPQPPTDEQKWAYFTGQRRWIFVPMIVAFFSVQYGMVRLSGHARWTWLFLLVVAFQSAAVLVSLRTATRKRRLKRSEHEELVAGYEPERWPSVDVFLPSAGEELRVLANTYRYVAALDWPGPLTVYVLDDSARPEVHGLAARHGFVYLTRPDRGHLKKAGNLAFGYRHSCGELIAVFDADFAPRPDTIRELAPYLQDQRVGIVQSPQFFQPTRHQNWLERAAGATQELFYRWVQPARDAVDAAICVGTNALYRRSALEAAGGFAQIGHSEDVHTGVNLAKVGFCTRYVPVNLAKGVCPDDFDAFANQQYRWCTGSMSLLTSRSFHTSSLSWRQKSCFWTGFLYYLTTAAAVFTVPIPGLVMLYRFPWAVRPTNYLPIAGVILVWAGLMPMVTAGRWSPLVVRVQNLIAFCHALALYDLVRGRTAAWIPTGAAGRTPTGRRVQRLIRWWVVGTQGAFWLGVCHGVFVYGLSNWWTTVACALPSFYFLWPLVVGSAGLRHPAGESHTYVTDVSSAQQSMVEDTQILGLPPGFEDAYHAETAQNAPFSPPGAYPRESVVVEAHTC